MSDVRVITDLCLDFQDLETLFDFSGSVMFA